MRYATTAARSEVLHKQDNGITRSYCSRTALHVVDAETASAGLSTGALRVCKNCDNKDGDRRRAALSLADQPLLNPPAAPARRKTKATPAEPALFDPATPAATPAPAKPKRARRTLAQPAIARTAFDQSAAGLTDPLPAGRYALQVCEDPESVCKRGACTQSSTRAVGTFDEVSRAAAHFRHAWAESALGARIALTEQPAQARHEQAPVEPLPEGEFRVKMRMQFDPADLERLKIKATAQKAADNIARAEQRAAERIRYGVDPAPAPVATEEAVEGTVVAHQGDTFGCLPHHAEHPDVLAALTVLGGNGRQLPIRLATLYGNDNEQCTSAFGAMVEPRRDGRVALCWLVGGKHTKEDGDTHRIELVMLAERMSSAGWLVESGSVGAVFAWNPDAIR